MFLYERLSFYWIECVKNEKNKIFLSFLSFLSHIYKLFVLRRREKILALPKKKFNLKVIGVGNIVLGGTGKTPLVIWLTKKNLEKGLRVGIVFRGYAGEARGTLLVQDGKNILSTPYVAGDEAYLVSKKVPGTIVIVDRVKERAIEFLQNEYNCDIVILDDAYQYWSIKKDLDIVTIDAINPWGCGYMFPRGFLREPKESLARANVVVISRFDLIDHKDLLKLMQEIRGINPNTKILLMRYVFKKLVDMSLYREYNLNVLNGKRIFAFCGIGNPDSFFLTCKNLGINIVGSMSFPDHTRYSEKDLLRLYNKSKTLNVDAFLTTEKDIVKFNFLKSPNFLLYALSIEAEIFSEGNKDV
ncbi:Tetraacyldisaccharide 4'-kinase [Thermodesulfobium narugense DSM 14796]|uniref:Tetraacyldisaccharide 4'-kinase n=1 Tax=Thermodesulfobium narugense DSM 14796 TaxID=747365 RepID=M1E8K8_9BACT|nr:tetraacyldisaccharide 4'-kinase [Thermodesulfobium narugense]AEE15010.1 Tetraacyldisaccharide 4'-kinase [Thermodesulfobium narugense DSM 14796]